MLTDKKLKVTDKKKITKQAHVPEKKKETNISYFYKHNKNEI